MVRIMLVVQKVVNGYEYRKMFIEKSIEKCNEKLNKEVLMVRSVERI